jgi:arginine:pyruvate transaminase
MAGPRRPPVGEEWIMRFAERTGRLRSAGKTGWEVHDEALRRRALGQPVVVLSQGDHDFPSPAPIVAAAKASLDAGRHHYTPLAGEPALRRAIAAETMAATGVPTAESNVIVLAGAQNALFSVAQCLLDPGDEAIIVAPHYVTYPGLLGAAGATVVTADADPDRGFALRPERIAAALTPRTRLILLNTPNNPSGAIYGEAELGEVAALCRAHDLWLVADEVYAAFVYEGVHRSPRALPGMAERTVVVSSLSKSHGMTGWRLGWAIGPEALVRHLRDLALAMLYGQPGFVQDAGLTALAEPGLAAPITATYRRRRDAFIAGLTAAGLPVVPPAAGLNVMLDVRALGQPSEAVAFALLEATGIATLPGDSFGACAQGFLRASLSANEAVLADAAARIGRFLGPRLATG